MLSLISFCSGAFSLFDMLRSWRDSLTVALSLKFKITVWSSFPWELEFDVVSFLPIISSFSSCFCWVATSEPGAALRISVTPVIFSLLPSFCSISLPSISCPGCPSDSGGDLVSELTLEESDFWVRTGRSSAVVDVCGGSVTRTDASECSAGISLG